MSVGPYLLGNFPRMVFRIGPRVLLGCFGLDSDARLLGDAIRERISSHQSSSYRDSSSFDGSIHGSIEGSIDRKGVK